MKSLSAILIIGLFFSSCEKKMSMSRGIKMNQSDRLYGLICIDETLDDTLMSFRIDLKTDLAEIHLSDEIDLGLVIDFNYEDQSKFYDIQLYKLKQPCSGDYKKELQNGAPLFPKGMNIRDNEIFSNSILMTMILDNDSIITSDEQGCGENIVNTIYEMGWFPKIEDHDYTVLEYYQDSRTSWVYTYRRK